MNRTLFAAVALAATAACTATPPTDAGVDAPTLTDTTVDAINPADTADVAPDVAIDAGPPPTRDEILAATWRRLPTAPTIAGKQDDVFFINPRVGWSVNGQGNIFHTDDGGDTWARLIHQPGTYFRAVAFIDDQRGFFGNIASGYYPNVTDDTPLYMTTNGGQTIAPVETITGDPLVGVCNLNRIDSQHIVATGRVGGPSFFARSDDGGATWTSTNISTQIAMLVDSHFSTPMDGYVTGASSTAANSRCVILHTADGGATWQPDTGLGPYLNRIRFVNNRIGYAIGTTIYKWEIH